MDDFGTNSYSPDDVNRLVNALKPQYTSKMDWTGNIFLDLL